MKRHSGNGTTFIAIALAFLVLLAPAALAGGAPSIVWSPSTTEGVFDFGAVPTGQTSSQVFTLSNLGGSATGALKVSVSGSAGFSLTADGCRRGALGPRKICTVTVEYAPSTAGQSDHATLRAIGKKPSARIGIDLTGKSAGGADLSLSPGTFTGTTAAGTKLYDFVVGTCECGPVTESFMVTNDGTGATGTLTVNCCTPHFFWANDTCTGSSLAPGEACLFELTFNGGCNPGDSFDTPLEIVEDTGVDYIHLDAHAFC